MILWLLIGALSISAFASLSDKNTAKAEAYSATIFFVFVLKCLFYVPVAWVTLDNLFK